MKRPESIDHILCYLRRSRQDIEREKRTGEDTLAQQRQMMERLLEDYSIPYQIFEEIGSGDKIDTRPVFKEVLKLLENGAYKAIAVREISRMGRGNYADTGRIVDILIAQNILVITPYKTYDPSNYSDLRQIRFELFLAREEFETIRERMMSGKVTTARQGKWSCGGTAPYGYRVNDKTQRLEICEDEARVVRLIFDLYSNGHEGKEMGFRAISTFLTRSHIPTPSGIREWSVSMVKKILIENQETYTGSYLFGKTRMVNGRKVKKKKDDWIIVDGAHPAIIDMEISEKVQKKYTNKYKPRTKMDLKTSELAGIIVCSRCGKRMTRQANVRKYVSKKTGATTIHTRETLWCNTTSCTFVGYRAVEEAVLEFLDMIGHMGVDDFQFFIQQTQEFQKEDQNREERLRHAEESLQKLLKRAEFIYERFEEGTYSREEFLKRRDEINQKIEEAERTIQLFLMTLESPKPKIHVDTDQMKKVLRSISRTYRTLENTEDKNRILRSIIDYAVLELTEKVGGNKPSKFNLDIYFRMEEFLTI